MKYDPKIVANPDEHIKLSDFHSDYTGSFSSKKDARKKLEDDIEKMKALQDKLYAHNKYSFLLIFQAMDAAGKDGTIKHVMSGVNPQGCQVFSFKKPSDEELDHDYFWRIYKSLPERGRIGIFNRSYYEEVLVAKVHPGIILNQQLPGIDDANKITPEFWEKRYQQINDYEKHWVENGIIVLKFFLNVSKEEQKRRFLERINNPIKNWKFTINDIKERNYWDDYQKAFEEAINKTSTELAPWYIVPADNKWFMRTIVSDIIVQTLESLPMSYPSMSDKELEQLKEAKEMLENE